MSDIESTGHKPTERERALTAVKTALLRIRREVAAALIAIEELKKL